MSSPHINRVILLTIGLLPACGVLFVLLPILRFIGNPVVIALAASINWALFFAYASRYRRTEFNTFGLTIILIFVTIFLSISVFLCGPANLAVRICWGLFDAFKLALYVYSIKPETNCEFIATSAYYALQTLICFITADVVLLASTLLGIWSLTIALAAVPIREPTYLDEEI